MKRLLLSYACLVAFCGCNNDLYIRQLECNSENSKNVVKSDYYWGSSGKIFITKSEEKYFVVFTDEIDKGAEIYSIKEYNYRHPSRRQNNIFVGLKSGIANADDIISLKKSDAVKYVAPFYKMPNGKEYPLTNIFYVELKNNEDLWKLNELANKNNINVIGEIPLTGNAYILCCTKESAGNALEMANLFYETGEFQSSAPEFRSLEFEGLNDPYYPQQWNLKNTGQWSEERVDINFSGVRSITTGSNNITVAVVDVAIPLNHPDLIVSSSYNASNDPNANLAEGHGIACAGIISAQTNNGEGIAGIAPSCNVMSISISMDAASLAEAIRYAADNGADVISNSWGRSEDMPIVNSAIKYALQSGRGGKGCVVVFSSGNDNTPYVNYPKAADSDIIVVGSITPDGLRKEPSSPYGNSTQGSNYGDYLDVVAPGVNICTTDSPGAAGYNDRFDGNYVEAFGGTSAACPHVSGVAALMLSVNPSLTQREVGDIIERTAAKLCAYQYVNISNRQNGTWNNETGYGLLDAKAAVLMAKEYNKVVTQVSGTTITTPSVYSGDIIKCNQVMVYPGGVLILSADEEIELTAPFTVQAGGAFEFYVH